MKRFSRAGAAALIVAAVMAQSTTASALPPPPPASVANPAAEAFIGFYVIGFMLCTGLTFGKQDVWAAKSGAVLSFADRLHAVGGCLLPPVGIAKLMRGH
jgi:hypothetical protein